MGTASYHARASRAKVVRCVTDLLRLEAQWAIELVCVSTLEEEWGREKIDEVKVMREEGRGNMREISCRRQLIDLSRLSGSITAAPILKYPSNSEEITRCLMLSRSICKGFA